MLYQRHDKFCRKDVSSAAYTLKNISPTPSCITSRIVIAKRMADETILFFTWWQTQMWLHVLSIKFQSTSDLRHFLGFVEQNTWHGIEMSSKSSRYLPSHIRGDTAHKLNRSFGMCESRSEKCAKYFLRNTVSASSKWLANLLHPSLSSDAANS